MRPSILSRSGARSSRSAKIDPLPARDAFDTRPATAAVVRRRGDSGIGTQQTASGVGNAPVWVFELCHGASGDAGRSPANQRTYQSEENGSCLFVVRFGCFHETNPGSEPPPLARGGHLSPEGRSASAKKGLRLSVEPMHTAENKSTIGVTGHQRRAHADWRFARDVPRREIELISPGLAFSSLAVGSDQLFADVVLNLAIPNGLWISPGGAGPTVHVCRLSRGRDGAIVEWPSRPPTDLPCLRY
jgi:hypothetical protein